LVSVIGAPHGDMDNSAKQSGRGYAATYLVLAFAVVASNLKRIVTFFVVEAARIEATNRLREPGDAKMTWENHSPDQRQRPHPASWRSRNQLFPN
jgi:hypothetical protein